MRTKVLVFLAASLAFALALAAWLWPAEGLSLRWAGLYGFLVCAHLFYVYNGVFHISLTSRRALAAYVGWYVVLVVFFAAVAAGPPSERLTFGGLHRQLHFGLFLLVTSAFFHIPVLFGFLAVVLVAYFVLPFYAEAALLVLTAFYLVVLAEVRQARERHSYLLVACFALGFVVLVVVLFPLVHLSTQRSPQDLKVIVTGSGDVTAPRSPEGRPRRAPTQVEMAPAETRRAIWMSLKTATTATALVLLFGVPLAYFLVRSDFPGRGVVDALVDLPIVLPPPAAGLALVFLVGQEPGLGTWLRETLGLELVDNWKGIVLAQMFVSCPFLIRSAQAAFRSVDAKLENVSRTLGASPARTLWRVTLPLGARGIFMGCILTWGRAVGEFGSVSFIAEHPETVPVRIYKQFLRSGVKGPSLNLAILMILLCVLVFAGLHLLASRTVWRNVTTIWSGFRGSSRRTPQAAG
ncbi:MAG: molybdate ABC transporter permease subunit [Candidatus Brocadiia bacterium]